MALTLLATSPRVAPGLLSWRAWSALRSSARVLVRVGHPLLPCLEEAGVRAERVTDPDPAALVAAARAEPVLWIAGQDGDGPLMRELGALVVADPLEIEVVHGSYDLPGARMLDLVQVMDTLRRECPWDREQTHESLVPYLLEESYEVADTVADGDLGALREELGDVLMQVAFHAAVAAERDDDTAFTVDDVAGAIVDKLIRRHPHVFADVAVSGSDEVNANWERIKAAERAERSGAAASVLDGVPAAQPSLSLAAQTQRRAGRLPVPEELYAVEAAEAPFGARLFALVREAREAGADPEAELRAVARAFGDRVRAYERSAGAADS